VCLFNEDYANITADDVSAASTKVTGTFDLEDAKEGEYKVCVVNSYDLVECDSEFDIAVIEAGSIAVLSSPSGASIYVDGTAYGTIPDTVDDLVEWSHKFVLKKSGYDEWGMIVTVKADEETDGDVDLKPVTTVPTTVRTNEPALAYAASRPMTGKTTRASTIAIPTSWVNTTEPIVEESPPDPVVVIGACRAWAGDGGTQKTIIFFA